MAMTKKQVKRLKKKAKKLVDNAEEIKAENREKMRAEGFTEEQIASQDELLKRTFGL